MASLLPAIANQQEYEALQPETATWLRAIKTICHRHGLSAANLVRLGEGTNVVFTAEDRLIIKLYPPYWQKLFEAERTTARYLYGKLDIATPEILAADALEGWPYLVMTKLEGQYLVEIWDDLAEENRLELTRQLGEIVARLHSLPVEELNHLAVDWPAFVQKRIAGCVARHREQGLSEQWLEQLPTFLASAQPLYPPSFKPSLISGDIHQWHLMVKEQGGRWRITGLFDFDDAFVGFPEYDLAATSLFVMHGRATLLRTFLLSYGYPEPDLTTALSKRFMAYTLLHRYRPLNWILEEFVADPSCTTLDQLATTIYPL